VPVRTPINKFRGLTALRARSMSAIVICLLLVLFCTPSTARGEKIRTVVPQSNLNYLSVYVAESKGFFNREGLENETLVLAGPVAAAALLGGSVDFGGGGGSAMRGAVGGAPLKAIFFQTDKVTSYLVTDPSIVKPADLRGKKIAVGGIGSSQDRIILKYIEQANLTPGDITRIAMGADAGRRIQAIKSGSIHATLLDPGTLSYAEKEGLNVLAFMGDLFPFPFQAFATTDKKLKENPEQVKRWLRAMVGALMFVRDQPEEAAEVGIKRLRVGNVTKSAMVESIKRYNRAVAAGVPGLPSSEGIRNVIDYEVRQPLKIEREIPQESLMNLKFMEQVKAELESKKTSR
jgi:ABC-type nitrate/sulfonate/bicarbonate transport system substrate-binding protein